MPFNDENHFMASPWGKRRRLGVESAKADAARGGKRVRAGERASRCARAGNRGARARERGSSARIPPTKDAITGLAPVERGREREARGREKSAVAHLESGGGRRRSDGASATRIPSASATSARRPRLLPHPWPWIPPRLPPHLRLSPGLLRRLLHHRLHSAGMRSPLGFSFLCSSSNPPPLFPLRLCFSSPFFLCSASWTRALLYSFLLFVVLCRNK
jgi:hypothetical protein